MMEVWIGDTFHGLKAAIPHVVHLWWCIFRQEVVRERVQKKGRLAGLRLRPEYPLRILLPLISDTGALMGKAHGAASPVFHENY